MSNQAKIEIYYWRTCPYCAKARALLDSKEVEYEGYDITGDNEAREAMIDRTGGPKSIPQIFIGDKLIGGCDDLYALENKGELDALLKG